MSFGVPHSKRMTFIEDFEALRVTPANFHHRDHVRLAWEYLRESELIEALQRFRAALQAFANHVGATMLYHETITVAFLLVIHDRMQRGGPERTWEDFEAANPDLFRWKPSILDALYEPETLASPLARKTFLMPDARR